MTAVLGIDAAWTATNPSGVALISNASGRWRSVALAPSYASFVALTNGVSIDWKARRIEGGEPDVPALLDASRRLLDGASVDVVAIDMPIATIPFDARREADNAITRAFAKAWCSTHSPSATRPGAMGRTMTEAFVARGFEVGVKSTKPGTMPVVLEVYPHTALLALMRAEKRLEYKIGKQGRDADEVRALWLAIIARLRREIGGATLAIPERLTKARMKRYEDAIDALVCAWVGARYVAGKTEAYGDETAAVWVPR